jgi:vacuolar-type H+-ATPase subunit H
MRASEPGEELATLEQLRRDEALLDRGLEEAREEGSRAVGAAREEAARIAAAAHRDLEAEIAVLAQAAARELEAEAASLREEATRELATLRDRARRNLPAAAAFLAAVVAGEAEP